MKVGEIIGTRNGDVLVTRIQDANHVTILFVDPPYTQKVVRRGNLLNGRVANKPDKPKVFIPAGQDRRLYPTVLGKGNIGIGPHTVKMSGQTTMAYRQWVQVLKRDVCKEWTNYQNFAEWFYTEYRRFARGCPFELSLTNRILVPNSNYFSPETCCFAPPRLIRLFSTRANPERDLPIGVYRWDDRFCTKYHGERLCVCDTVEEASMYYWKFKIMDIQWMARDYAEYMPEHVVQHLNNMTIETAKPYFPESLEDTSCEEYL